MTPKEVMEWMPVVAVALLMLFLVALGVFYIRFLWKEFMK